MTHATDSTPAFNAATGTLNLSPLRIALVGAGKMARQHAAAIARLDRLARLVAVADPVPSARDGVLEQAPGARAFDTLPALLSDCDVDVVHVCTPPATHRALGEAAVRAGCHIYVEKPFAESAADATSLLELADAKGVRVCAGHQLLFERPALQAMQFVPALGQLVHVESYFSFRTVRRGPGGTVPLRADLQLLDILPHPVYLLLRFLDLAAPDAASTEIAALELGRAGTVHALLRRSTVTGSLVVTLEGRPIESYVRLVGTNGMIHADFVRGTVQRLFGPGTSTVDKLLAPYRLAWQTAGGATAAFGNRFLRRQRSYPGLAETFEAFYRAIQRRTASPVSPASIVETVRVCEAVASRISAAASPTAASPPSSSPGISTVVTGGNGFLGRAVVRALLERGAAVRVLTRRLPAPWERIPGVSYVEADLGRAVAAETLAGAELLIHAAAETAGGWDAHQRNSIDATEKVLRAAAAAGVRKVIHVSSVAVVGSSPSGPISEETPLAADSRGSGPYVWGKLESERLAVKLSAELRIAVKVVRPGAIVDYAAFEAPGRLGKRVGPVFVAVGSPRDRLGVIDLAFTADVLAWMATHFEEAPATLNLLDPDLPTKRELVQRLRQTDPDLKVVWLPWPVLLPLSGATTILQKLVRPGRPAISLRRVFASPSYDTAAVRTIVEQLPPGPK